MAERLLITGASGFLGRHLISLLEQNASATIAAVQHRAQLIGLAPLQIIPSDNLERELERYQPTSIVHLATSYGRSTCPSEVRAANVILPIKLLEAGVRSGCTRFVLADSFFAKAGLSHRHLPDYVQSKRQLVDRAKEFSANNPLATILNLRLEHVYGPGDGENKFVPWLLRQLTDNIPTIRLSPGEQLRDFIFVTDAARAFQQALRSGTNERPGFYEFQIGTGIGTTVREFCERAKRMTDSQSKLDFGALPADDLTRSVADLEQNEGFHWKADTTLEQGLRETLASR